MTTLQKLLLLILALLLGSSSLLMGDARYKYSYLPKQVYENQLFPITILEIESMKKKPKFRFADGVTDQPLFAQPLIVKNGNDSFYTFYFKALQENFHLPALTIEEANSTTILQGTTIPISQLKHRDDFCGVLATDMKIKSSQTSTYDEQNNLITLSIEAYGANIEDINIIKIPEDGVENIKRKNAKVVAEYFAVIPSSQKEFKFSYFNTIKGQYLSLQTPIVIKDYSISSQSEVNPKDDSFDKLKKSTFILLSLLFFILFLWKRDLFYLILFVVAIVTLFTFYTPKKKICVEQGASLYILPTHTSRISTKVESRLNTHILGKRSEFNKIEYKNNTIGWIKDEDLCKD